MKVKIKDWWAMAENYGIDENGNINCRFGFKKEMRKYCGKVIELHDINFLVPDNTNVFEYGFCIFSNEMYDVIEE